MDRENEDSDEGIEKWREGGEESAGVKKNVVGGGGVCMCVCVCKGGMDLQVFLDAQIKEKSERRRKV